MRDEMYQGALSRVAIMHPGTNRLVNVTSVNTASVNTASVNAAFW